MKFDLRSLWNATPAQLLRDFLWRWAALKSNQIPSPSSQSQTTVSFLSFWQPFFLLLFCMKNGKNLLCILLANSAGWATFAHSHCGRHFPRASLWGQNTHGRCCFQHCGFPVCFEQWWAMQLKKPVPQCFSQDIKETLGEDEAGELKTLSEEPKYFRCLLAKPGQLGSAHYRSSGWN